ncbi:hypothetical protein [Polyangium spumosum]|uniref:PepSY domain-containing protein n=1 Tax=Polyangium spumosum TaxID=889282 RepID=A0A6N7PS70_9BACT|nr:hypothetical protein [Polyangium spumosum]MRG91711.1 hypothetical protein [Polyangium spumosum]
MLRKSGALVVFGLALGLCAPSVFAQEQQQHAGQQQQQHQDKMTPKPLDLGGRSMEELFKEGQEVDVPLASVPGLAQQTLQQWSKGGKLEKIEKHTLKDGRVFYQGHIDKAGQMLEVIVTPEGQTVRAGEETAD